MRSGFLIIVAIALFVLSSCTGSGSNTAATKSADPSKKIKIGFSMDTLKEERWQKDRALRRRLQELEGEVDRLRQARDPSTIP